VLQVLQAFSEIISVETGQDLIPPGMDPQFRIDGVSDGVLLAMEWASNCVFRLFECVCDVAAIWIIVDSDDVDGSHVFSV
jgi:hypothetical protein